MVVKVEVPMYGQGLVKKGEECTEVERGLLPIERGLIQEIDGEVLGPCIKNSGVFRDLDLLGARSDFALPSSSPAVWNFCTILSEKCFQQFIIQIIHITMSYSSPSDFEMICLWNSSKVAFA